LKGLVKRGIEVYLFSKKPLKVIEKDLEELKKHCLEIKLIEIKELKVKKIIKAFLSIFSSLAYGIKLRYSGRIKKKLERFIDAIQPDAIICDSIYQSLNIPLDFRGLKILYEHNVESVIVKRYLEKEKNIFKKIFARIEYLKMERFQKKMWGKFDLSVASSSEDKKLMEERVKGLKIMVLNNGVDTDFFQPNSYPVEEKALVYTGQIGWFPNEDAVIYFIKNIYPLIKKEEPEAKFWIVGEGPSEKIRKLASQDKSLMVTGLVEDVRLFLGRASVFVVPLRIGSGTRLKILEAMAMGKPIVSTSLGCEGLEVRHKENIVVADNPEDFANAVILLLKNKSRCRKLGENARKLVETKYDWEVVFGELDRLIETLSFN